MINQITGRIVFYFSQGTLLIEVNKPATIKSYIAAMKTVLREDNIEINEDRFLLNSLVRACRLKDTTVTIRLPIQKHLLHSILDQLDRVFLEVPSLQIYLNCLYKAMFAAAYYGLLRIGEVAKGEHPVLAKDVHIAANKNKILFVLWTSKTHGLSDIPQSVKISSSNNFKRKDATQKMFCPYRLLRNYIEIRPEYSRDSEPFFVFRNRSPVKTITVSKLLKDALCECKIDSTKYSFHGLRASRGVDLLRLGVSVETIKKLGRWKSNAVFAYLNKFN